MKHVLNTIGGLWVSLSLFIRCKCRTGKGSYLAWRNETAFGKKGQFPEVSKKQQRKSVREWSRWAFRTGARH